jgi:hypothetical protein
MKALLRSLARLWPDDPSAPGVVMAWLPAQEQWYLSVVRYTEPYGEGKRVVWNTRGEDFSKVLDTAVAIMCAVELT